MGGKVVAQSSILKTAIAVSRLNEKGVNGCCIIVIFENFNLVNQHIRF